MLKIKKWANSKNQSINDGTYTYDIASVIFQSKDLIPFKISLDGMRIDYKLTNGYILDFIMHMNAIFDADLSKPIILDVDGWVIDGRHRIAKAIYLELYTVLAVRFEEKPNHKTVEATNGND